MVTVSSYTLQILSRAFPKDSRCLSKSYYKILFSGALNRRLKGSMFYCYPNSSGLLSLLKIVAKMIHISSFILLLLFCANKSILGNLMKQCVLGESFDDLESKTICLWYWRFLCKTDWHEQNEVFTVTSLFVTCVLSVTQMSIVAITVALAMHSVFLQWECIQIKLV